MTGKLRGAGNLRLRRVCTATCLVLTSMVFSLSQSLSIAQSTGPVPVASEKVSLMIGLGYMLCGEQKVMPPIDSATQCPGLEPGEQIVELELKPQKTSRPDWRLWSTTYRTSVTFDNVKMMMELLVSISDTGVRYGHIEGRISSGRDTNWTHFSINAEGGFDHLNHITNYGSPISYVSGADKLRLYPWALVYKKP